MTTIGIYKLNFTGTDKVYIGQSRTLEIRLNQHLSLFRSGNHTIKMQAAYSLYGKPTLEVLCECSVEELNEFENETIEIWDAVDNGFNSVYKAGEYASMYGEAHGHSVYSNIQILEVLEYIIDKKLTFSSISSITGVHITTIESISQGIGHKWLQKACPEKYELLLSMKGRRTRGELSPNSKYLNLKIIEVFNYLVDKPEIPIKQVSTLTEVSYSTVKSIASGSSHSWLKESYPEKYAKLMLLKGTRSSSSRSAASKGILYPNIIDPDGIVHTIENCRLFATNHSLDQAALGRVLNGKAKTHKGWKLAESKE